MVTTLEKIWTEEAPSFAVRRPRPILEFAEADFVLPSGRFAGMRFSTSIMPWTRLILEEFDRDRFGQYWASGPAQTSKTVLFLQIPLTWALFELAERCIVGLPRMKDAGAFWRTRIEPCIRANPKWAQWIPEIGPGSKGGFPEAIAFGNGGHLRFMSGSGEDEERSMHEARFAFLSEVDKYDTAKTTSRESDPITQILTRLKGYGELARVFAECTLSTKEGRVYREICEFGTDSAIWIRCPACLKWLPPEREHFGGWSDAETIVQAQERGRYRCQHCAADWTEDQRRQALLEPRLVARGQSVDGIW